MGGVRSLGLEGGGYKESLPWCSLFVGFSSLFVAPSSEQLALPVCWMGTSLSTISSVFGPIFFYGLVAVCTRIPSQEYVYDK